MVALGPTRLRFC